MLRSPPVMAGTALGASVCQHGDVIKCVSRGLERLRCCFEGVIDVVVGVCGGMEGVVILVEEHPSSDHLAGEGLLTQPSEFVGPSSSHAIDGISVLEDSKHGE